MSDTATIDTESDPGNTVVHAAREPRADKVATVAAIAGKLDSSLAVFVTEYRGLTVGQLADIRNALRPSDAEVVVYKNTLARLAIVDTDFAALDEYLVGPTALTFVKGDVAAAAKAIRDSSKTLPALVVKGGVLGGNALSAADVTALAAWSGVLLDMPEWAADLSPVQLTPLVPSEDWDAAPLLGLAAAALALVAAAAAGFRRRDLLA